MSTSGSARRWSMVSCTRQPYVSPKAVARPGSRSAAATSRIAGWVMALRGLVGAGVRRQVHDDVDVGIGKEVVDGVVHPAAVRLPEGGRPSGVEVRRGDEPDRRVGHGVAGIAARDVAGADDADTEGCHERRGYVSSMPYRARMRHDQIALQLYTVRGLMADDLAGTLRAVATAGYRAVELAGLPETEPGALTALLDESGLQVVASHE